MVVKYLLIHMLKAHMLAFSCSHTSIIGGQRFQSYIEQMIGQKHNNQYPNCGLQSA